MKLIPKSKKRIAFLLSIAVLLQSCAMYLKSPSIKHAVSKKQPVKIKTTNKNTFKFKNVFFVKKKLYGTAKSGSTVSTFFKNNIVSYSNNPIYDQIDISELKISKVYVHNTFASIGALLLTSALVIGLSSVLGCCYRPY